VTARLGLVLGLLLTLALTACSSAETSGPPEIQYGRDICVQCGMIINEEKYAAAYTLGNGTERLFGDLGDLIRFQRMTGELIDPERTWVHDVETVEWVGVTNAYFVATLSVRTPMGHGIVALSDEGRANTFASEVDGEVIRWDVVFALPEHNRLIGQHHAKTDDTGGMDGHSDH